MGIMPASNQNGKSNGLSDAIINADNHCNSVNTEDGAKMVFEKKTMTTVTVIFLLGVNHCMHIKLLFLTMGSM